MALQKKDSNSYRPIAVGETLRRLVSRLCCNAVRSKLPETYNQVGVGIKGGLAVPKDVIYDQLLNKFDIGLWSTLLQIIHTSIPNHAWLQV